MLINAGTILQMKSEEECRKWCELNNDSDYPECDPGLCDNMPFDKKVTVKSIDREGLITIESVITCNYIVPNYTYSPHWFYPAKKINI